ncbi:MAG: accessory Sec system glycosylation chaperone GtfB [Lachnospiraceae bacterium]|jgi:accessory Sec system glycosyltransferase GtfB|nr:accessory Sec system glycosylation chaperone GtfB [Lachnospiraceae bacterium]
MDKTAQSCDIVLLFDQYSKDSRNLHVSFQKAGYECQAIVIEDDGFLPEHVISIYGFFLGDYEKAEGIPGRPRYFNQITVPEYWEISGTNRQGKVHDLHRERGKIFYAEPRHRRLVQVVDWYDERHVVRSSDHYNRYGALYARTTFNAKGQRVNKSWFSADGREVIVENYVTGDIILNEEKEVHFFRNRTELAVHVLERAGLVQNRIFFNSLSVPFFVSQRLHSEEKRDILFWQEPVRDEIPGNMQIILKGQATRTAEILVQKKNSYERLLQLGASSDIIHPLGFLYPFERENRRRPEALICTNSERVEKCRELVEALPGMHFHIAAITEMSSKLMRMDSYENVTLYPGVKSEILDELFDSCDYYLDINHESEIVSAVYRAFQNNQLILAFQETLHNQDYTAKGHIWPAGEVHQMIGVIQETMTDEHAMAEHLHIQHTAACAETEESYQRFRQQ